MPCRRGAPQLAGELIHRQIDAVNYPLLLDMWRRATSETFREATA